MVYSDFRGGTRNYQGVESGNVDNSDNYCVEIMEGTGDAISVTGAIIFPSSTSIIK